MDTLYTFIDNIPHYKTESVHIWRLMNSATKNDTFWFKLYFLIEGCWALWDALILIDVRRGVQNWVWGMLPV